MNQAKQQSNVDGKAYLRNAFLVEKDVLLAKLKLSQTSITHDGVMGDVNEKHFIDFLRKHLPKRYAVDSAIIIDVNGATSDQIDIVIYDNQYTPTLLGQHDHRFVPAEAVYGVIEVKPKINKVYLSYALQKAHSVNRLERTSVAIPHAGGEYPPKPNFSIITGLVGIETEWTEGLGSKAFDNNIQESSLDFVLSVKDGLFDHFDGNVNKIQNDNAIAYFLFRLLQKLQSLGTVPAVDWNRYAQIML